MLSSINVRNHLYDESLLEEREIILVLNVLMASRRKLNGMKRLKVLEDRNS